MANSHYDSIVIGTGGVGSAALLHLAERGEHVLGIDRFRPPHAYGSSHGQTRIIRQAYFEHADYTPLVCEAYRLWEELERSVGEKLYVECGVLQIGPPEGEVVSGVKLGADAHGLQVEQIAGDDIENRWPALRVPAGMIGMFEARAGYLRVEQCVQAHLNAACKAGAELETNVDVRGWEPGPPAIVNTNLGVVTANRLIITTGAWAQSLLADLGLQLTVLRKSLFWYPIDAEHSKLTEQLPCFLYELPSGVIYGFPPDDQNRVKIAEHSGGQPVVDPLQVNREVDEGDEQLLHQFISDQLRGVSTSFTEHAVCLYTMSADHHFIVDRHPDHPHVAFAAGLSGHGFKFTSALGKALSELVLDGQTQLPVGFLALR